jgi:hypothetical protein
MQENSEGGSRNSKSLDFKCGGGGGGREALWNLCKHCAIGAVNPGQESLFSETGRLMKVKQLV